MNTLRSTIGRDSNPATIAWVFTWFIVLLALRLGKEVVEDFLMKLYEFFILRNLIGQ